MVPLRLQKIDEFLLPEHIFLEASDHCYFLGEYASGKGYGYKHQHQRIEEMNDVMINFKKPVDRQGNLEWCYKEHAISKIADYLISLTCWDKLKKATWVPFPPSSKEGDLQYDDRLWNVLSRIKEKELSLDIRKLLVAKETRNPAHISGAKRLSIQEHIDNLCLDETKKDPCPELIIVFDDVITTGSSFKAAQFKLKQAFTEATIIGIFVARNIHPDITYQSVQ